MRSSLKKYNASSRIFRRCRPLLGTFVEIAVRHDDRAAANAAVDAAFAGIERLQRLMSFHRTDSEVSKLNRLAARGSVTVSEETYDVLTEAQRLYDSTGGLFDITVASQLMKGGFLPKHRFLGQRDFCGTTAHIQLLSERRVRYSQPLCIDLGGIAKGFAVDQTIRILRSKGITEGLINAGGDMRSFGDQTWPVWVRHPRNSGQLLPLLQLKNAALATSANSYDGQEGSVHIHGQMREPLRREFSVTVHARRCLVADALTKVVLALEEQSAGILKEFGAQAFVLYPNNRIKTLAVKDFFHET